MFMTDKPAIITVAVTGSVSSKEKNKYLPVTPKEIADSALEAHRAGAAIAHIHVRDPETSRPSSEYALYEEVVERIRGESSMIVNLTTGPGGRVVPDGSDRISLSPDSSWFSPKVRAAHVVGLKPDVFSLEVSAMNYGSATLAYSPAHAAEIAALGQQVGATPEIEVFDIGHINIAKALLADGRINSRRPFFQMCLGIDWGIPATTKHLMMMLGELPEDCEWSAFSIGRNSFPMVAQSALLGGNVRVGFEDNFYLTKGVLAKTNAELVEKAVTILRSVDRRPATAEEARRILNLS